MARPARRKTAAQRPAAKRNKSGKNADEHSETPAPSPGPSTKRVVYPPATAKVRPGSRTGSGQKDDFLRTDLISQKLSSGFGNTKADCTTKTRSSTGFCL